ncbi:hypothetical protein SprV_1002890800 [Sparganum proliferum]
MKARIPDNGTCQETKMNELPQRLDSLPFANAAATAADENGSVENSLGHNPVEGAGRPRSRTPPPTTCSSRITVCKKPT